MVIVSRTRLSVFAFAFALCGCTSHAKPCWFWQVDTRPLTISSWNPPPTTAISCPWKSHKNLILGDTVEGKVCDWDKIRCNRIYESCVQTSIRIPGAQEILVACLPHYKKPIRAFLTQPAIVSRRRRNVQSDGCRKQRRIFCRQYHRGPATS